MAGTLVLLAQAGFEPHMMNVSRSNLDSNELSEDEITRIRRQEAENSAARDPSRLSSADRRRPDDLLREQSAAAHDRDRARDPTHDRAAAVAQRLHGGSHQHGATGDHGLFQPRDAALHEHPAPRTHRAGRVSLPCPAAPEPRRHADARGARVVRRHLECHGHEAPDAGLPREPAAVAGRNAGAGRLPGNHAAIQCGSGADATRRATGSTPRASASTVTSGSPPRTAIRWPMRSATKCTSRKRTRTQTGSQRLRRLVFLVRPMRSNRLEADRHVNRAGPSPL